ncbi:hypothetical protein BDP27DRAFT_1348009 [Rhodocollybia butyracea]|uniref:Uncharacterized protein n=1 Tax=Rhodocollybia butyracea TaxID=206335 RepID=A0A9P5P4X0_9AGAR|nr:hypothetical protein BDP27DRAFT_1348009 [Rhodocollybia butyracea]
MPIPPLPFLSIIVFSSLVLLLAVLVFSTLGLLLIATPVLEYPLYSSVPCQLPLDLPLPLILLSKPLALSGSYPLSRKLIYSQAYSPSSFYCLYGPAVLILVP